MMRYGKIHSGEILWYVVTCVKRKIFELCVMISDLTKNTPFFWFHDEMAQSYCRPEVPASNTISDIVMRTAI